MCKQSCQSTHLLCQLESRTLADKDKVIGYEPADLIMHPLPRTAEGGFIFSYRCLVFPNKCP